MDPTQTLDKSIASVKKMIGYFQPFKPDVRSLNINYKEQRTEIIFHINVPSSLRRRVASIKIPAYEGFSIPSVRDESFNSVDCQWKLDNQTWVLNPSALPASEDYFIVTKGQISKQSLDQLVRIQTAMNRDRVPEIDKYWLNCMIRNQEILERMYRELEIREIDVKVKVGVERCFSTAIPKQLKIQLEAMDRWIKVGFKGDREEVRRARMNLQIAYGKTKINPNIVASIIEELTDNELFGKYVTVDLPFTIGSVRRNERFAGLFPNEMFVEALTELNLKRHEATGYLSFERNTYINAIKEKLGNMDGHSKHS